MGKVTRTYLKGCESCCLTGRILDSTSCPVIKTCPVCNGSKVITVTEEYDQLYEILTDKIPPTLDVGVFKLELKDYERTLRRVLIDEPTYTPNNWKMRRLAINLSLRQVAKETGISPATISRLERTSGKGVTHYTITTLDTFYKNYGKNEK